ncbi:hypothetical protein HYY72_00690 [Candidatus Woesearchaeota archaeon]|nr:hypothetical protein [Candidatus Woesearchaeota archaeon]
MEDDVKRLMEKIQSLKKGEADLSRDEDLSIGIMNLISLEEHSYFTAMKTGNRKYLEMMNSIRELRKKLLKKIVQNPEGEEWCISKHLLAASMRLIETGTKEQARGRAEDAELMFNSAFHLYTLFFAINMKLVDKDELRNEPSQKSLSRFSAIVKKLVDCCKE